MCVYSNNLLSVEARARRKCGIKCTNGAKTCVETIVMGYFVVSMVMRRSGGASRRDATTVSSRAAYKSAPEHFRRYRKKFILSKNEFSRLMPTIFANSPTPTRKLALCVPQRTFMHFKAQIWVAIDVSVNKCFYRPSFVRLCRLLLPIAVSFYFYAWKFQSICCTPYD